MGTLLDAAEWPGKIYSGRWIDGKVRALLETVCSLTKARTKPTSFGTQLAPERPRRGYPGTGIPGRPVRPSASAASSNSTSGRRRARKSS